MTNVGGVGIRAAPQYYRLDTSICNGNTDTVGGVTATEWVSFKQIKAPTFACIHERRFVAGTTRARSLRAAGEA
jgi:hypothetical protein